MCERGAWEFACPVCASTSAEDVFLLQSRSCCWVVVGVFNSGESKDVVLKCGLFDDLV